MSGAHGCCDCRLFGAAWFGPKMHQIRWAQYVCGHSSFWFALQFSPSSNVAVVFIWSYIFIHFMMDLVREPTEWNVPPLYAHSSVCVCVCAENKYFSFHSMWDSTRSSVYHMSGYAYLITPWLTTWLLCMNMNAAKETETEWVCFYRRSDRMADYYTVAEMRAKGGDGRNGKKSINYFQISI